MTAFHDYLRSRLEAGGFSTEDTVAVFVPLIREVLDAHAVGTVAPLEGLSDLHVDEARIWFEDAKRLPSRNNAASLRRIEAANQAAVEILSEQRNVTDVSEGTDNVVDLAVGERGSDITRPVYLPGYIAWEHQLQHHDPLSDIFCLGMILASLACGMDFSEPEHLKAFVAGRRNLFSLNPGLHPVLARAIFRMTELDRHRRVQDLGALLHNLENYREQDLDFEFDLARVEGFKQKDSRGKQQVVLSKLQERLFEISRRNRLLHFRPTMQTINLTHASVPLSFDIKNIRPDQILVWNKKLHDAVCGGKAISLNKYLNFAEALYIPSVLDRIIAETRRDRAEFGFAQLRLVICMLHWTNLKEKPIEHFDSPLVLLPVELKKKKGIRDKYSIQITTSEAEVNPVVRHQFKQLYDMDLPEQIDLSSTSLDQFFEYMAAKIEASEAAVTLNKIDKPRIDLVYDKARRKLDQYRRRARIAGRGVRSFMDLDYSYDPATYHPLGVKLFSVKVRPPNNHLREIIDEKPRSRTFAAADPQQPVAEKERTFFSLRDGGDDNPYSWNFDLCSVTLGNFKYRKMSLVRDYEALLQQQPENPAFEATFSLIPKPVDRGLPPADSLEDRYDVVPCDPTQAMAIEEAHAAKSYIIQGPPGTGKSQTITNLIADYVARDKRVLLVCEKRAAIDVVFARLRQCGLDGLCCLIHDSQTDKKAFVMDLKQCYEDILSGAGKAQNNGRRRSNLLKRIDNELRPLQEYDTAMQHTPDNFAVSLRQLLGRCVELRRLLPQLTALQKEQLPDYAAWRKNQEAIDSFAAYVQDIQPDGILANHPLKLFSPGIAGCERPLELVTTATAQAQKHFESLERTLDECGISQRLWQTPDRARALIDYARCIEPVARAGQFSLLNPENPRADEFNKVVKKLRVANESVEEAGSATKSWRDKLPAEEVSVALRQAEQFEQSFFAWLKPQWWRLRSILNRCYDFRTHVIRPSWTHVLAALEKEYALIADVKKQCRSIEREYNIDGDVQELAKHVSRAEEAVASLPDWIAKIHAALLKSDKASRIVEKITSADDTLASLVAELDKILQEYGECDVNELRDSMNKALDALDDLPAFIQCVSEIASMPEPLSRALRTMPLTPAQLEAATADHCIRAEFRNQRNLHRFSESTRKRHVSRLEKLYDEWLRGNAAEIRRRAEHRFRENVRISSLPAAQLNEEEKAFKCRYNRGRREIEHEFGKSMRYKSIRDLVSDESGDVVKDLKPVWLMSPLSVSDTLPLDSTFFDVVIFDEASQITLEEAIPSVFRACQAIVVGDEMQLPPTDFFSARRDTDEEELYVEENGEMIEYDLQSNSFLNHTAKNLPSSMLGWHYRSRSESLISYSNWAFYNGRLLTVPEESLSPGDLAPLVASSPADAQTGAGELLERAISFHFMENGVYDKRRNRAEAEYIACLVRELLQRPDKLSIGIVAFSEAQQDEIEGALQRLAQEDAEFGNLLETEQQREEDGQFVGLLVKNLENIQGDERDIIILSVCYGYGPEGKMRMNFGPINKSGGEKRLNVAFSRAKHHMALVSSIHHADITNDYNDGANCLKNYLRYAEAVSNGDTETARRVLHGMSRWGEVANDADTKSDDPVAEQLAGALADRGFIVDRAVGQSHFRCDLAVRRNGDEEYRLGVLVDTKSYYEQCDLLERDMMRPRLLRNFGWKVAFVLAKDWYEDPASVLERLLLILEGGDEPQADDDWSIEEDLLTHDEESRTDQPVLEIADETPQDASPAMDLEAALKTVEEEEIIDDIRRQSPETTQSGANDGRARLFEYSDDRSNKFWEITLHGNQHTVRFGRIGTQGQNKTKQFDDSDQARRDCERLIRSKLGKGYQEK
ncbi:MAG: WGR domain-containing protein [Pirellulales bacterium]|nr:WGR domain-containing protein [Pirellulales bacterium]